MPPSVKGGAGDVFFLCRLRIPAAIPFDQRGLSRPKISRAAGLALGGRQKAR